MRKSAGKYAAIVPNHFNYPGGTIDVQAGALGLTANGASTGGTFNTATGISLHLGNEGGSGTMTGTFTGSGASSVVFGFSLFAGQSAEGTTYNFPAGLLHWNQGYIYGTFTNAGFMTLSSAEHKSIGTRLVNTGTLLLDETALKFFVGTDSADGVRTNRTGCVVELRPGFAEIHGGTVPQVRRAEPVALPPQVAGGRSRGVDKTGTSILWSPRHRPDPHGQRGANPGE